jgi:GAF domain-containing protein
MRISDGRSEGMMAFDYSACCRWLLAATGASRTTIRLTDPAGVPELVGEAVADGVGSIRDSTPVNAALYPTYQYLVRTHDLLIQNDTRTHPVRPPEILVDELRVYAQMLAPIVRHAAMVGVISVHVQGRPHHFDARQVAALRETRRLLQTDPPGSDR